MTATEPAPVEEPQDEPEVALVETEPEDDEGANEGVELVRSGWVRLRWEGQLVRFRRPFLGEMKTLRLALEDASDAISERSQEVQIIGRELIEANTANDADEKLDDLKRLQVRRELTDRSKVAGRELTAFTDQVRLDWWRLVAETVGVDDPPLPEDDLLPAWILDPFLPTRVLQHWRAVPLGRG